MMPLDELLYPLLGLPVEWLAGIVFGKILSDLLAGIFGLLCLVALVRTRRLPGLRTQRRAGWGLALALVWIGTWWWAPFLYAVVNEALQVFGAIPATSGPEPPPPPPVSLP